MNFKDYNEFNSFKVRCRDCEVGKIYDKAILSDGCNNPTVIVIGEAPGKDEILEGKPFVGKAGKLLREILNELGFRKTNTLISNVIPCRPENNKFPSSDDLVKKCYAKWLYNEIKITNPKYLLLLGAQPLKFLLGLSGITKLRGQWFSYPDNDSILCMPTFHPSYVLRKEHMNEGKLIKAEFIDDIRQVSEKARFIG